MLGATGCATETDYDTRASLPTSRSDYHSPNTDGLRICDALRVLKDNLGASGQRPFYFKGIIEKNGKLTAKESWVFSSAEGDVEKQLSTLEAALVTDRLATQELVDSASKALDETLDAADTIGATLTIAVQTARHNEEALGALITGEGARKLDMEYGLTGTADAARYAVNNAIDTHCNKP